jgi:hypothetical protein
VARKSIKFLLQFFPISISLSDYIIISEEKKVSTVHRLPRRTQFIIYRYRTFRSLSVSILKYRALLLSIEKHQHDCNMDTILNLSTCSHIQRIQMPFVNFIAAFINKTVIVIKCRNMHFFQR